MKSFRNRLYVAFAILILAITGCESVKIYGPIESRPEEKAGTWVIGGRSFNVTQETELEEEHGPLVVGACAEVELKGIVVKEIESEEPSKCRQYDSVKIYGLIESRPEGKVGTWMIGGRSFDVTDKTKLEEDDGPLLVGTCAEVEFEGNTVKEIESEEKSKCEQ